MAFGDEDATRFDRMFARGFKLHLRTFGETIQFRDREMRAIVHRNPPEPLGSAEQQHTQRLVVQVMDDADCGIRASDIDVGQDFVDVSGVKGETPGRRIVTKVNTIRRGFTEFEACLRQLIEIQENSSTSTDSAGAIIENWSTIATSYASIEPVSGNETISGSQIVSSETYRFTMAAVSGVNTAMRILYGTRVFDINAINKSEEPNREMVCICQERG